MSDPRVLLVDDEPELLEGLRLVLRPGFDVVTAVGGEQGLAAVAARGPFAVVVSDLRMPGMDGATFLARVRAVSPDSTRVLLTGNADVQGAIAAVNEGAIFRFLTKPCAPPTLVATLRAAAEQQRLVTAERVLLQETLRGAVRALANVLALSNPTAFGRALRVQEHVRRTAGALGLAEGWAVELAALLSQVGCVTMPPETVARYYHGAVLDGDEREQVARLPRIGAELAGAIPRLEPVRDVLLHLDQRGDAPRPNVGAQILRIALDFDLLEARGDARSLAASTLRGRDRAYDPALLDTFFRALEAEFAGDVEEASLQDLRSGMVLAEDLRTLAGVVLVARGHELTPRLLERLRSYAGRLVEPARVIRPRPTEAPVTPGPELVERAARATPDLPARYV